MFPITPLKPLAPRRSEYNSVVLFALKRHIPLSRIMLSLAASIFSSQQVSLIKRKRLVAAHHFSIFSFKSRLYGSGLSYSPSGMAEGRREISFSVSEIHFLSPVSAISIRFVTRIRASGFADAIPVSSSTCSSKRLET